VGQAVHPCASCSAGNTYGWIGQFPKLREWSGDRSFKNIKEHGYSVMNNLYEATVDIPRTAVEDDDIGVYAPLFREMGYAAGTHPDEIVFGLLKNGMSGTCYDGKAFFAVDHPVYLNADGSGDAETVSNWLRPAAVDGTVTDGTPWFVLDVSRPLRPFIFQERTAPELQVITNPDNDYVFMKDKIPYGIRYRCNGGYGFWQQAVCSTQELNAANFAAALEAMQSFRADGGRPLGLGFGGEAGTMLVVAPVPSVRRPPRRFRRAGPRRRQQYLVPRRDAAGHATGCSLAEAEGRWGRGSFSLVGKVRPVRSVRSRPTGRPAGRTGRGTGTGVRGPGVPGSRPEPERKTGNGKTGRVTGSGTGYRTRGRVTVTLRFNVYGTDRP